MIHRPNPSITPAGTRVHLTDAGGNIIGTFTHTGTGPEKAKKSALKTLHRRGLKIAFGPVSCCDNEGYSTVQAIVKTADAPREEHFAPSPLKKYPYVRVTEYESVSGRAWGRLCHDSHDCVAKIEESKGRVGVWASPFGEPEIWVEICRTKDFQSSRVKLLVLRHDGTGWKRIEGGDEMWNAYWKAHRSKW